MNKFIFLPVPTEDLQAGSQNFQEGLQEKGKEPYKVLQNRFSSGRLKGLMRSFSGCLAEVKAGDTVYIMLHGIGYPTAGSFVPTFVGGNRSPGNKKSYTPSSLAEVLQEEGLTKQVGQVKLFACGSGLDTEAGSWASRLKIEMQRFGFGPVIVTGYLGDVRPSYAPRHTANGGYTDEEHKGIELNDGFIYRASEHKVSF